MQKLAETEIAGNLLPLDLLIHLFSFIHNLDAYLVSQVCRWWFQLLTKDENLKEQIKRNKIFSTTNHYLPHPSGWIMVNSLERVTAHSPRNRSRFATWAATQNLELLKYFIERGFVFNEMTMTAAAAFGKLECMKELILPTFKKLLPGRKIKNILITHETFNAAAAGGHVECLRYLTSLSHYLMQQNNGKRCHLYYPWTTETTFCAAKSNKALECLEILRDIPRHGCKICPWDSQVFMVAAERKDFKLMLWLRDKNIQNATGWIGVCPVDRWQLRRLGEKLKIEENDPSLFNFIVENSDLLGL
jgi:hypothetical protein